MRKISAVLASVAFAATLGATEKIATVNGVDITHKDLQGYLQQIPEEARASQNLNKEGLKDQLIQRELLTQYALQSNITEDHEYKELLNRLKRDLALEIWMNKQMDSIDVSDAEIRNYYDQNKERFSQMASDQIRAAHILVDSEAKAKELIEQLQGSSDVDADFKDAAKQYSTCPSAQQGGDLGYFGKGQMVPEFDNVVFSMDRGQISKQPVRTDFGYHVIYVADKKDRFKVLEPMIRQNLKMPQFQQVIDEITREQKEKAQIKIY